MRLVIRDLSKTYPNGTRALKDVTLTIPAGVSADISRAQEARDFGRRRKLRERANAKDPADPFIDREGYLRLIARDEKRFRELLATQQRRP